MKFENNEEVKKAIEQIVAQHPVVQVALEGIYKGADIEEIEVGDASILVDGSVAGAPAYWVISTVTGEITEDYNAERDAVEEMEEEEMTATREYEEITLADMAREKAEICKEKLEEGFKFVVENVDTVKDHVVKMANMSNDELEVYLEANCKNGLGKVVDAIKDFASKKREEGKAFSFFADAVNEDADRAESVVSIIKEIIDEDGVSGWGKFKFIVKELAKWILRILVKVGAIVLKIAFTVVVGAIKIGSAALVATGKVAAITYKEVGKPVFTGGKKLFGKAKNKIDETKAAKEFEKKAFEEKK